MNLDESEARQNIRKNAAKAFAKATQVTYRPGFSRSSGHQGSEDCNEERKLGHDDGDDGMMMMTSRYI
jgi:hypothetical protein